jgi:hypothetical protein
MEAYMETTDEMQARLDKAIAEAGVATEAEMRDAKDPWPRSPEELTKYIAELVDRPHSYGTTVYAMSLAAVAAFHYVAHRLGVSGFQASCADMDFLKRTRSYEHGFKILDAGNLLYPQYNLEQEARDFVDKMRPQLAEEARKLLRESGDHAHPNVRRHWEELASQAPAT